MQCEDVDLTSARGGRELSLPLAGTAPPARDVKLNKIECTRNSQWMTSQWHTFQ